MNAQLGPSMSVNCDFDGTITTSDITDLILSRLAEPAWLEIEAEWLRGEIGSLECMARQVPLIRGGWRAVEEVLSEVEVEPTFFDFVSWCESRHIPVTVVSEGLDRVILSILNRYRLGHLRLIANQLVEDRFGRFSLSFPYRPKNTGCRSGVCKCQSLLKAQGTTIVIGDGKSDFCWGERADVLFAKSKLLTHCETQSIPCFGFTDFKEIRVQMEELISTSKIPARPGTASAVAPASVEIAAAPSIVAVNEGVGVDSALPSAESASTVSSATRLPDSRVSGYRI